MSRFTPDKDAEWMMRAIIDDFALSLALTDRARFYVRLSELALNRCDLREEFTGDELDSEPWIE